MKAEEKEWHVKGSDTGRGVVNEGRGKGVACEGK